MSKRDWQIDFGPVSGPAGLATALPVQPQTLFRGENVLYAGIRWDTSEDPDLFTGHTIAAIVEAAALELLGPLAIATLLERRPTAASFMDHVLPKG